jgi:hypothetical protein
MNSNDTLINAIIADMQTIQKKHMALEEHEAYEEAEWAEELVAEKKAALEKAQHALHIAEEDLEQANRTYKRIREVPRSQRRGVNFKTNTTLDDRLGFRAKWDTLNNLLKLVGKEQQTLEYLDRPWRAPLETDTPQAQAQVKEVEAPKLIKGSDGLAEMSWARLYVPSPPPSAPAASAAPAQVSEPPFSPPTPVSEVENTYVAAAPAADAVDALRKEKASLKRQIRAFDEAFSKSYGRLPTNAEKEHLRPLYNRYCAVKKLIEDGGGHPPAASDASDTAAPSVEEPNTYVPPPRVLDAEQYWPASRCRNLAKEVLREKPSRNHFGLIQQLSSHYKMTPEAFKKKNPIYLTNNVPLLKKILGYIEYRRLTMTR